MAGAVLLLALFAGGVVWAAVQLVADHPEPSGGWVVQAVAAYAVLWGAALGQRRHAAGQRRR